MFGTLGILDNVVIMEINFNLEEFISHYSYINVWTYIKLALLAKQSHNILVIELFFIFFYNSISGIFI